MNIHVTHTKGVTTTSLPSIDKPRPVTSSVELRLFITLAFLLSFFLLGLGIYFQYSSPPDQCFANAFEASCTE